MLVGKNQKILGKIKKFSVMKKQEGKTFEEKVLPQLTERPKFKVKTVTFLGNRRPAAN